MKCNLEYNRNFKSAIIFSDDLQEFQFLQISHPGGTNFNSPKPHLFEDFGFFIHNFEPCACMKKFTNIVSLKSVLFFKICEIRFYFILGVSRTQKSWVILYCATHSLKFQMGKYMPFRTNL